MKYEMNTGQQQSQESYVCLFLSMQPFAGQFTLPLSRTSPLTVLVFGCGCVWQTGRKGRGKRTRRPFTGHLVCRSEPSRVSAARRPHTERNVSQSSHIHQGPTVLALGPVQLLTSEATSRDTRPDSRGPEGRVGMVAAIVAVKTRKSGSRSGVNERGVGSTGPAWLFHISEPLSTRGLKSSTQPTHKRWVTTVCVCVGVSVKLDSHKTEALMLTIFIFSFFFAHASVLFKQGKPGKQHSRAFVFNEKPFITC